MCAVLYSTDCCNVLITLDGRQSLFKLLNYYYYYAFLVSTRVTGPAKIWHVGSQNLTTFQISGSHNF